MKQLPKVGEVGRCETLEELVEIVDSANQKWDLDALRDTARQLATKGQPFSPAIFDELSQEDLDWLTAHFDIDPVYWIERFHTINGLFRGEDKEASNLLSRTRELLPDGVSIAPVFLMVAVAYTAMKSQEALTDPGRANAFEHAENLAKAIKKFEGALAKFQRSNKRKTGKEKGTGHVHMDGVELFLSDGKLTADLVALRNTIEEEKASIATALKEIRATQEDGVMPSNRQRARSIGDRMYDALEACQRLIAERWRAYDAQKVTLSIFDAWDMKIKPGRQRVRRLRRGGDTD